MFTIGGDVPVPCDAAYNREDITGERFGFLTAINYEKTNRHGKAVWRCRCDCGKEVFTVLGGLKSGNTKSCGCGNKGRFVQGDIKVCRKCKSALVAGENFSIAHAKNKNWICKQCHSDYFAAHVAKNPYRNHASAIKSKYGITSEVYEQMYNSQDGKCAICKSDAPLHSSNRDRLYVDHCHETGFVRGLLCKNCNSGIGQFRDSINALQEAIKYLQSHSGS